jgi:hypothetical protein
VDIKKINSWRDSEEFGSSKVGLEEMHFFNIPENRLLILERERLRKAKIREVLFVVRT